jgi:deoxyguanosine kinase
MAFRIEICGGIASGKTTFARLFAEQAKVIYEDFLAVPFWEDFYAAPAEHAFETELSFLLQHYHQVKRAQSESHTLIVCDFSFALDAAYAHVSLNPGDLKAFLGVLEQVRR